MLFTLFTRLAYLKYKAKIGPQIKNNACKRLLMQSRAD